jgi:hypothetical protein
MGNKGVRKKEGRSQPYPLAYLSLPTIAAEAPIPALEYQGNGLEFLAQTLLSRPLAWVRLPHWKFQVAASNFSGTRSIDQVCLPHWKFQLRPTKFLVNYDQPIEDPYLE